MRHFCQGLSVAILGVLLAGPAASAATIYDVLASRLDDPAHWYAAGYGSAGYTLMWSSLGPDGKTLLPDGRPTGQYSGAWTGGNPAWLRFQTAVGALGGDAGSSPAPEGSVQTRNFTLESIDTARQFDFSVLFYDPGIDAALADDAVVARVTLTGAAGTTGQGAKSLTAADVRAGTMLTFDVLAGAGEQVGVAVETVDTYAAGFFLDNAGGLAPEPATMALVAAGLGGLALRRRRR